MTASGSARWRYARHGWHKPRFGKGNNPKRTLQFSRRAVSFGSQCRQPAFARPRGCDARLAPCLSGGLGESSGCVGAVPCFTCLDASSRRSSHLRPRPRPRCRRSTPSPQPSSKRPFDRLQRLMQRSCSRGTTARGAPNPTGCANPHSVRVLSLRPMYAPSRSRFHRLRSSGRSCSPP